MGSKVQGFILYRIYYGEHLVYVGRTKQPLQTRIRGHLFDKPMHRKIDIEGISKIEYAEFKTEADMNLYEIYFILLWHPPLNVDDKTPDYPTVELPPVEWKLFETPLWEKWRQQIFDTATEHDRLWKRYVAIPEQIRVVKSMWRTGEIDEDTCYARIETLRAEMDELHDKLWK